MVVGSTKNELFEKSFEHNLEDFESNYAVFTLMLNIII